MWNKMILDSAANRRESKELNGTTALAKEHYFIKIDDEKAYDRIE
jgi:hypothetical protein